MAHYKRKHPRTRARPVRSGGFWLAHWPRWWDIVFHTRPRRRRDAATIRRVRTGRLDPDAALWDTGNSRPHHYFW